MALTTLDPRTALIVIDLQKGVAGMATTPTTEEVLQRSRALAHAFRHHHLPVVWVNVDGGAPGRIEAPRNNNRPADWAELVPGLVQSGDHLVTKRSWGAFSSTDLDALLKAGGVTQIVLCGIATSIGVESTARFAHELGYNVTLAVDAMSDFNPDAHANSISRIFPRLGESGSTQDIISLLDRTRA